MASTDEYVNADIIRNIKRIKYDNNQNDNFHEVDYLSNQHFSIENNIENTNAIRIEVNKNDNDKAILLDAMLTCHNILGNMIEFLNVKKI